MDAQDLGIVETQYCTVAEPPHGLHLKNGEVLGPITIAYETYGTLNEQKSNAILICHALSGDAHAAGYHADDKRPGWWNIMVGPGKAFDTDKYFIICSNVLGGCKGTTGPSSLNPKTGKPFGLSFPVITIRDMVVAQRLLIDYLGIKNLLCVAGGSMGGFQTLQWTLLYPEHVTSAIVMACNSGHTAQQIAFNEVARQAIMSDPDWQNGDYYGKSIPARGLAVARMIGHITYMSNQSMEEKFGRKLMSKERLGYDFSTDFEVESYLKYRGDSFVQRFDANSWLYLSKANDYFNLEEDADLITTFAKVTAKYLLISFNSDWLYPTYQLKEIVRALKINEVDVSDIEINSSYGHDAFLIENTDMSNIIANYLKRIQRTAHHG